MRLGTRLGEAWPRPRANPRFAPSPRASLGASPCRFPLARGRLTMNDTKWFNLSIQTGPGAKKHRMLDPQRRQQQLAPGPLAPQPDIGGAEILCSGGSGSGSENDGGDEDGGGRRGGGASSGMVVSGRGGRLGSGRGEVAASTSDNGDGSKDGGGGSSSGGG
ncbi:unnamed protein product [Lampetra planeri]